MTAMALYRKDIAPESRVRFLVCFFLLLIGLPEIVYAELPRTGQRSCYDEKGVVIDHAGTGQDGDLQAGGVWPDPRFSDNGDGTITDHLTGLIWLQDGGCLGSLSWQGAMDAATNAGQKDEKAKCAGLQAHDDWQVPEIDQLEGLFNAEEVSTPVWMNKQRFRNIQPGLYWSRTGSTNQYGAWAFDLANGEVRQAGKVDHHFCLLVRSSAKDSPALTGPKDSSGQATRFVDNNDGTVLDKQSGLMWLKDASCLGRNSWSQALTNVGSLNNDPAALQCRELQARYTDWSLPNRHELRSLVDHRQDLPALPENHPFAGVQTHYWSSTTTTGEPTRAFELTLATGSLTAAEKGKKFGIWAVRPAGGRPDRKRADDLEKTLTQKDVYLLSPLGPPTPITWPVLRFTGHADGTMTDNITGLMWMKYGGCFEAETWENAWKVTDVLNTAPEKLKKCPDYTARYGDWQLPDLAMMEELLGAAHGEPAAWLNSQGAHGMLARDYWVREKNYLNLYFAWAVNLRQGTSRNYPKSFQLHVWPVRRTQISTAVTPIPHIMGNGSEGKLVLPQGKELVLAAAIDQASSPVPSVFRIWYTAPDGKSRWLSSQGEWVEQEVDTFSGNLFQLDQSPLFRGDTTELALGEYTFFFAIKPMVEGAGEGKIFRSELQVTVSDDEAQAGARQSDANEEFDQEVIEEEVLVH
ncbi:MAG: hypothetical protein BM485_05430 [Desulfobulbaceae bacterium DB1]|nr:MAG: hypothetical protein BM485_05430 [Desulfobulbaceae bacterium DB1]